MPEPSWLESRKKKSHRVGWILFLIVIFGAGIIFFKNNHEVLFAKSGNRAPHPPLPKPAAASLSAKPPGDTMAAAAHRPATVIKRDSVMIPDIACRLRGSEAVRVILSLEVFFPSGPFRQEVLLKRENLRVMVQKTIAEKTMSELIADSLRQQAKRAMNRILEKGAIGDVVFRNFTIEKVQ